MSDEKERIYRRRVKTIQSINSYRTWKQREYGETFVQLFIKEDLREFVRPYSNTILTLFGRHCFEECNDSDRLKCILRPCIGILEGNNRSLLDFYIDAGIKKEDLPLFCYSQQKQDFARILSEKEHRVGTKVDKKLFLNDFLDILFPEASKPLRTALQAKRTFIQKFKRRIATIDDFTVYPSQDPCILFSTKSDVFFIDVDREIVTLNPSGYSLREPSELTSILSFFSQKYSLQAELIENAMGWNFIQFQVYTSKEYFTKEEMPILQKFLLKLREDKARLFSTFFISKGDIYVNIDVYYHDPEREGYFTYNSERVSISSLEHLFFVMKRIQNDIAQKLDELEEEFKEKTEEPVASFEEESAAVSEKS